MSDKSGIGISAKLEVKTEVPSDASGRLVHSAIDIVTPLTEWLGLQGDRVRIHRRVVVAKLLKKAEEEIAALNTPVHPVPLKIAVPLIEHASQEEPDDDFMIRLWAKLLTSSATSDAVSPRFASLLSELNGRQAMLLEEVCKGIPSLEFSRESQKIISTSIERKESGPGYVSPAAVQEIAGLCGASLIYLHTSFTEPPTAFQAEELKAVDFYILESLGLVEIQSENVLQGLIDCVRAQGTVLGLKLLSLVGR